MYIYTCVSIFVCLHLCIYACVCVCVCVADHTQIRLAVSFVLVRRPANHGLLFEGIILPESKGAGEGDGTEDCCCCCWMMVSSIRIQVRVVRVRCGLRLAQGLRSEHVQPWLTSAPQLYLGDFVSSPEPTTIPAPTLTCILTNEHDLDTVPDPKHPLLVRKVLTCLSFAAAWARFPVSK